MTDIENGKENPDGGKGEPCPLEPLVYIPPGAKINIENIKNEPPPTKYEKDRWVLDINGVKKFVGGIYGKKDD